MAGSWGQCVRVIVYELILELATGQGRALSGKLTAETYGPLGLDDLGRYVGL